MFERGGYPEAYPYRRLKYLFRRLGADFVTTGGEGNPDEKFRYEIGLAFRAGILKLRDDPQQRQYDLTTHFNRNNLPEPIRTFELTLKGKIKFGLLEKQAESVAMVS